jgi:hypothetical protein
MNVYYNYCPEIELNSTRWIRHIAFYNMLVFYLMTVVEPYSEFFNKKETIGKAAYTHHLKNFLVHNPRFL